MGLILSPSLEPSARGRLAHELKFVVDLDLAEEIHGWSRAHLQADPCGNGPDHDGYDITTLYLDTPGFDVLRRQDSFGRGKYRIRRYGESDQIFVERKMKSRGLVGKRRSNIPRQELPLLALNEPDPAWPAAWFHRRLLLRNLHPVCQVSYSRIARVGQVEEGPVRLTIDRGLHAWHASDWAFVTRKPSPDLTAGIAIVELKFRDVLPQLFERLLLGYPLAPRNMSKYRLAARELGFAARPEKAEWRAQPCLIS